MAFLSQFEYGQVSKTDLVTVRLWNCKSQKKQSTTGSASIYLWSIRNHVQLLLLLCILIFCI